MSRHGGLIPISNLGALLHSSILFRPHQQRRICSLLPLVEGSAGTAPGSENAYSTQYSTDIAGLPGLPKIGIYPFPDATRLTKWCRSRNRLRTWLRWNPSCEGGDNATTLEKGIFNEKTFVCASLALLLSLAACGGRGDDALGDNIADNYDAAADNLETMADNTANAMESDALNQADAP